MDISFEYYKIFYYVAKYENITKAAMVLKSSQPNVTRIIHILEDQLDCRLFLREPRGTEADRRGKTALCPCCHRLSTSVGCGSRTVPGQKRVQRHH